jgi:hypothetical protein
MLSKYYKFQPAEEHRDEAAEFVDKIMEEQIEILHEGRREKISMLEGINRVLYGVKGIEGDESFYTETMINEYRLALSRHGVRCDGKGIDPGCIAIANNHEKIKKITGYATGYNRIFQRHKCFLDGNKTVYFLGEKNKKATIFRGLIEKHERIITGTTTADVQEELDWQ